MKKDPDEVTVKELVRLLAENRREQGLSKYRVADLSGLDARTIGRIEANERSPTLYSLLKIAKAQGVKLSELMKAVE